MEGGLKRVLYDVLHDTTLYANGTLLWPDNTLKMPAVTDWEKMKSLDGEHRDCNLAAKKAGKDREDKKRGAKEIDLEKEDILQLKEQILKRELNKFFSSERFEVMPKEGTRVTIRSISSEKIFQPNTEHIQKI